MRQLIFPVIATFAASMAGSNTLTRWLIPQLSRHGIVAIPNERSSHAMTTVRGAGVALAFVWVALALVIVAVGSSLTLAWAGVITLATGLSFIGFLDDVSALHPLTKLGLQTALSTWAVTAGVRLDSLHIPGLTTLSLGVFAIPICIIGIVAMVNLFNFMDGIDGLAVGQTLVAALVLTAGALIVQAWITAFLAAALAGVAAGFLPFNWSPARCFMGDSGSYFCGGALAALLLTGQRAGVPLLIVGLPSALFLADGIVTLMRRLVSGKAIWRPHRSHIYQQLVISGWSHAHVSAAYIAIAAIIGVASLLSLAWLART